MRSAALTCVIIPEYETVAKRLNHGQALVQTFSDIFAARSSSEWIPKLEAAGVPVCSIHSLEQILTHRQVIANRMVMTVPPAAEADRSAGQLLGLPFKLGTDSAPSMLPPRLGQHTEAVMRDWLGMNDDAIRALATQGAFSPIASDT